MASKSTMTDAEKAAYLQMLDQQSLASLLTSADSSSYGNALNKVYAMGGDATVAADEFLASVNSGLTYQEAQKQFDEAVQKGAYNLDADTAKMVSSSVLNALANKQKVGSTSSVAKIAKDLGFPELAFLAPMIGQQSPTAVNPYVGKTENMISYEKQIKALKSKKFKETGIENVLRKTMIGAGGLLGGVVGGTVGTFLPTGATTILGAGAGATIGSGLTSRIVGNIKSPELKQKEEANKQAIMALRQNLRNETTSRDVISSSWQRGYDNAIKKSGQTLMDPFELQKLQMIKILQAQG